MRRAKQVFVCLILCAGTAVLAINGPPGLHRFSNRAPVFQHSLKPWSDFHISVFDDPWFSTFGDLLNTDIFGCPYRCQDKTDTPAEHQQCQDTQGEQPERQPSGDWFKQKEQEWDQVYEARRQAFEEEQQRQKQAYLQQVVKDQEVNDKLTEKRRVADEKQRLLEKQIEEQRVEKLRKQERERQERVKREEKERELQDKIKKQERERRERLEREENERQYQELKEKEKEIKEKEREIENQRHRLRQLEEERLHKQNDLRRQESLHKGTRDSGYAQQNSRVHENRNTMNAQRKQPLVEVVSVKTEGYGANEISIQTVGHNIKVQGSHECGCDEGCFVRQFERNYALPENVDSQTLRAVLNDNGVLKIYGVKQRGVLQTLDNDNIPVEGKNVKTEKCETPSKPRIFKKKLDPRTGKYVDDKVVKKQERIDRSRLEDDDDVLIEVVDGY